MANFRHQVMLDAETNEIIATLPEKKKSAYVRTAIKHFETSKKQKELDAPKVSEKPIPTVRIRI